MQGIAGYLQYAGSSAEAGYLASTTLEHFDDIAAFDFLQRTIGQLSRALLFCIDTPGDIYFVQCIARRQQNTSLYQVLQLPHIPRPGIAAQLLYHPWCDLTDLLTCIPSVLDPEKIRQRLDVL